MKRSVGVTIFGVLLIIGGLANVITPTVFKGVSEAMQLSPAQQEEFNSALTPSKKALFLMTGAISLATGIGLIVLQRWAQWLTIILAGVSVLLGLSGFYSRSYWPMLGNLLFAVWAVGWNGLIIWYFLRPSVKAQFQHK